ncbi:MAG: hypothetical protein K5867_07505 [Bacteroidales bacterium]|nr:hypothetical protein [Bacteroidales bacterium]
MSLNVTVREPKEFAKEEPKTTSNNEELTPEQEKRLGTIREKLENEKYVLLFGKNFERIFGDSMGEGDLDDIEGLVKIKHNCRTVYRRFKGHNLGKESILMGYRTRKALRIKGAEDKVTVSKASWVGYLWHNQDSCVKWPFRIAFVGIIFALISFFCTMLGLFVSVISLFQTLISGGCCY